MNITSSSDKKSKQHRNKIGNDIINFEI